MFGAMVQLLRRLGSPGVSQAICSRCWSRFPIPRNAGEVRCAVCGGVLVRVTGW